MLIRQNATLKIKSIEIFAIMSCVFVTGIVLRFLEVSQSLSIKNKIAAMIPIRHEKLREQKEALYADYGKLKKQVKEYDVIKQNIDSILRQPREPEREKGKERGE